jgi:hypothetical protein
MRILIARLFCAMGNNGSYNNSNQYGASSSYGSQAAAASAPVVDRNAAPAPADDLDYLDIPAFLRRQAD